MNENSTVLIVDDDFAGREALKGVLLSQGYDLLEAENGRQAIELAKEHIPDIILLDVMMPEMDGFEVCRRLRSDSLLAEIPILMITALDDRKSRLAGIEAGADDFISKPYDRVELRTRVRTVTRLNRYRRLVLERARFVWVIENDQDGYLILDEQGAITYANHAAQALFNLPDAEEGENLGLLQEIIKDGFVLVPPSRWEEWHQLAAADEPVYLVKPQDDSSQPKWYEIHLLDLPWVTKQQRLVRIQDVTERMTLQLESWSFQAAANHKFITPLSNMMLSLQVIRILVANHPIPDLLEVVETMEIGFKRLENELKDILEYINAPKLAKFGSEMSLAELEALTLQTAKDLAIDDIRFQADLDGANQQCLKLSHRAVQVILWECLENARKFHPQFAPQVDVTLNKLSSDMAALRIVDNGVSLSSSEIASALTPYYQAEKYFTGEVEGMGLGLPTVASLVWQAGGDIKLYNRKDGQGVVVELHLPLLVEKPTQPGLT